MLIRPAHPNDVQIIYQFICELENILFDFPLFKELFLQNITQPNYCYLVVEYQKEVIGYLSCHAQVLLHHCGLVGEIQELFIHPAHRNKKIGQQLLLEVERFAQENGWVSLEVTCNKVRLDTHRFYKKAGFTNTHLKFTKELR